MVKVMMLKTTLQHLTKGLLKSLSFGVNGLHEPSIPCRTYEALLERYRTLIREFHDCAAEYVLPELSPDASRVALMANLIGTPVGASLYIVAHLQRVLQLDGEVCEFGVAQGATSA